MHYLYLVIWFRYILVSSLVFVFFIFLVSSVFIIGTKFYTTPRSGLTSKCRKRAVCLTTFAFCLSFIFFVLEFVRVAECQRLTRSVVYRRSLVNHLVAYFYQMKTNKRKSQLLDVRRYFCPEHERFGMRNEKISQLVSPRL